MARTKQTTHKMELEEALIIIKHEDEMAFSKMSPFQIARELDHKVKPVHSAKPLRAGALLVRTVSSEQTRKLLRITSFLGRPVKAEIAKHLNTVEAVAYAPSIQDTPNEELVSELQDQGVIGVYKPRARPDGRPNNLVRFKFRGLSYPESVTIGYEVFKLRLWVKAPAMCRRCAKYGHTLKNCTSTNICCLRCSEDHLTEDCQASVSYCPHCHGPHAAWEHSCPTLRAQMARAEDEQSESAGPPLPPRRPALQEALAKARANTRHRHRSGTPPPKPTAPAMANSGSQTAADKKTVATQTGLPEKASAGTQMARLQQDAGTQTGPPETNSAEAQTTDLSQDAAQQTDLAEDRPVEAATALPPLGEERVPAAHRLVPATSQSAAVDYSPLQTRSQRAHRAEDNRRRQEEEEEDRTRPPRYWPPEEPERYRYRPAQQATPEPAPRDYRYYTYYRYGRKPFDPPASRDHR